MEKKISKNIDYSGFFHGISALQASMIVQVLHPFDVIKTRLQSHDGTQKNLVPKYEGVSNAIKTIYQQEGLKGLYRGVCFTLLAHSTANFLFFGLYGKRKSKYQQIYGEKDWFGLFRASLESVLISCFLTTPMWVLKTRMLLNTGKGKEISGIKNFVQCFNEINDQYGVRGFFRGLSLSLFLSLNGAIQIIIYEKLDLLFNQYFSENGRTFLKPSINGIVSKMFTSIILYPLTTIRTRIQQNQFISENDRESAKFKLENSKYKNIFDVSEKIMKNEGIKGFYKGVVASLIRSAPSNAIFFFFYELFKTKLYKF